MRFFAVVQMREWGGRGGAPVAPGHCLNGGSRVEASGQSVVMGRHISYLAEALKAYIINLRVSSDKLHKSVSFIHSFIRSSSTTLSYEGS